MKSYRCLAMKLPHLTSILLAIFATPLGALAQSDIEATLCEAAKTNKVIELVYDKDVSKSCLPRLVDVHQVAIGNNGKMYLHGWQSRGCTKGRDFETARIFRFDKIKSVKVIDGEFGPKSQSTKDEGWDGCLGSNCFIKENICE